MDNVFYGLEYEGKLLGFYVVAYTSDETCDVEYQLDDDYPERPWLTECKPVAEKASVSKNGHWYECDSHSTPHNSYVGKCRVVKVTLTVEKL